MTDEIRELENELIKLKEKLAKARQSAPKEEVQNYSFEALEGSISLKDLFDGRKKLIVIHNMGRSCSYCTLWADGLQGQLKHYLELASFVLVSPDSPDEQKTFANQRGWTFSMVSDKSKKFTTEMGYWSEKDGWWPGVSTFVMEGDKIYRSGTTVFGPGDDFCPIFPIADLLGGTGDWEPKI